MGRITFRVVATSFAALLVGAGLLGPGAASAEPPAYTALGDSYSSGVGTRTYYADSGGCKRSQYAYPVLDASRLGATLTFAACAGAKVDGVLSGQLGSLNDATAFVTISVGGNDAGFSSVLTRCALPWPYTCWTQINNAQSFIRNTLPGKLDQVYSAIRSKAPYARVVVVGYPRLFNGEQCNFAARISSGEQSELNETADILAEVTAGRAAAHGFGWVDPRAAFTGHSVCDDAEWLNGLSDPVGESYHPNRTGQSAGYTPLVEAALRAGAVL